MDLEIVFFLAICAENDAFAIGGKEGATVVATGCIGKLAHILAFAIHDVKLKVFGSAAITAENDRFAIGGITGLGIIAR